MSMRDRSATGADLVAAGSDQVRVYLSGQGMIDEDIARHLEEARAQGSAVFTFGADPTGTVPRYTVSCTAGDCLLTVEYPA
jgi:hypothetical protein